MKTLTTLTTLLLVACAAHVDDGATQPALYRCTSRETTCSATDERVCFEWCETETLCTAEDPVWVLCGDREACDAECEPMPGVCGG